MKYRPNHIQLLHTLFYVALLSSLSISIAFQPSSVSSAISQRYTNNAILHTSIHEKSLNSNNFILSSDKRSASQKTELYSWGRDDEIEPRDRLKSCIPYMLPLLDGDYYGKYIYQRVPPLKFLDDLFISPLVDILNSFPFLGLVLFLLFSLGSRNTDVLSRPVRFNAQQAVLIDVALILPTLIGEGLTDVGIPRLYEEMGNNFVYYGLMSSILYSVFMNLRGRKPNGIPYLSNAADYITGPF